MEFSSALVHIKEKVSLTEKEESLIASKLRSRTYPKGQYIVQEGDISKYQTFILSGKVKTFYLDDNGNEHIVAFGVEDCWVDRIWVLPKNFSVILGNKL